MAFLSEHPEFADAVSMPERPELEICGWDAAEYPCDECGTRTFGLIRGLRVHVCSNRCADEYRRYVHQDWRLRNPRDPRLVNIARSERREAARAGRSCAHCGTPLAAERATKRFCSDICRVRASRATKSGN